MNKFGNQNPEYPGRNHITSAHSLIRLSLSLYEVHFWKIIITIYKLTIVCLLRLYKLRLSRLYFIYEMKIFFVLSSMSRNDFFFGALKFILQHFKNLKSYFSSENFNIFKNHRHFTVYLQILNAVMD